MSHSEVTAPDTDTDTDRTSTSGTDSIGDSKRHPRDRVHEPTTLYRFFTEDDLLLYVGISISPAQRFKQHATDKAWWHEVSHATMQHFPDRQSAEMAERRAIRHESPQYNRAHNERHREDEWLGKFMRDVWRLYGEHWAERAFGAGTIGTEEWGHYAAAVAQRGRKDLAYRAGALKDANPSASAGDIVAALNSAADDEDLGRQLEAGKILGASRKAAARNMADLQRRRNEPVWDGSHADGIAAARAALPEPQEAT